MLTDNELQNLRDLFDRLPETATIQATNSAAVVRALDELRELRDRFSPFMALPPEQLGALLIAHIRNPNPVPRIGVDPTDIEHDDDGDA